MGAFFATDFWPDDFWADGLWGDPDLTAPGGEQFWHQNLWLDTFWATEFWAQDYESESAGGIGVTLGDDVAAIVGNFDPTSEIDGQLVASLSGVTGSLGGTLAWVTYFDLDLNVSVNWTFTDAGTSTGDIAVTLEDLTPSLTGYAHEADYVSGFIGTSDAFWPPTFWDGRMFATGLWPQAASLEDLTAAFVGSTQEPGTFTGDLAATLEDLTSYLQGQIFEPVNFLGELRATLGDDVPALTGATTRPQYAGSVATSLAGVTGAIVGLTTEAGSYIGPLSARTEGVRSQIIGTYHVPLRTGTISRTLEALTGSVQGLALLPGAKLGQIRLTLDGISGILSGGFVAPRERAKADQPVVTEIDWKTLCDQHNIGLEGEYDYEFSNGRRFG